MQKINLGLFYEKFIDFTNCKTDRCNSIYDFLIKKYVKSNLYFYKNVKEVCIYEKNLKVGFIK